MSNDKPIDPRLKVAKEAFEINHWMRCHVDSIRAALAAADAYDAEHGVVRVAQSDLDNDAARIAAAQRAGQEIREALRLPATASWADVLAVVNGVPRYQP